MHRLTLNLKHCPINQRVFFLVVKSVFSNVLLKRFEITVISVWHLNFFPGSELEEFKYSNCLVLEILIPGRVYEF